MGPAVLSQRAKKLLTRGKMCPKWDSNQMHPDLKPTSIHEQASSVDRAPEVGARHLDVDQGPDAEHVVLADPDGNELCILQPGAASSPVARSSARWPAPVPGRSVASGATHWPATLPIIRGTARIKSDLFGAVRHRRPHDVVRVRRYSATAMRRAAVSYCVLESWNGVADESCPDWYRPSWCRR
ncbi:hypothetical protein I6N91_11020 [Arthrobacter sp. MSA 4-2]|nr:hypothetical protein [Arthrobacter sp. MSA 4-2]